MDGGLRREEGARERRGRRGEEGEEGGGVRDEGERGADMRRT